MELLQFILSSVWNFIGTIILIFIVGANVSNMLKAFRLFETNNILNIDGKSFTQQGTSDYTKMWEDLISAWKNKKSDPSEGPN
jgi:hypothetical protein